MSTASRETVKPGPLGLRHVALVYLAPLSLFRRVEDTNTYGWPLVTLLLFVLLIGYMEVQTGLVDSVADQATEKSLANLERDQADLIDRIELKERMDDIRKTGEFNKMLARLGAIVFSPAKVLASLLLITSALYAIVALTGRKPEYHTLMSICVYSGFILLAGYAVRLAMVIYYKTTDIDTSLVGLATPGEPSWLGGVDPFWAWFCTLLAMGLVVTCQLGRKTAWITCAILFLLVTGARVGLIYAMAASK